MCSLSVRCFPLSCLSIAVVLQLSAAVSKPTHLATRAPHGPFHVVGNQLIDSEGSPFLIRGTQTTPFHLKSAKFDARSEPDFGPHSATSFGAIRLRLNMNALRIPADISEAGEPGYFEELKHLVATVNHSDLVAILAATEPGVAMPSPRVLAFWERCASVFKDNPNVLFDAFDGPSPVGSNAHSQVGWDVWQHGMEDVIHVIRRSGARQPIALMSWNDSTLFEGFDPARLKNESDIVYEVSPRYEDRRTDALRDAQFGFLSARAPLIANDWDLHLDEPEACKSVPTDTLAVSQLVLDNMAYFDAHNISWTVSAYERGKLLTDTFNLLPTLLELGVTCGVESPNPAGMGRVVLSHMFGTDEGKLVVVNVSGGLILPRGGYSTIYGRIMAERDSKSLNLTPPYALGGVSVDVTDSANVTRPARLNWASAGWGSLNFVIPAQSAIGLGHVTVKRADGTHETADIRIADAAPGLFTAMNCQGPAIGVFTQSAKDGHVLASSSISRCKGSDCSTVAIPVAAKTVTTVRLTGNGFRNAASASQIEVTIAGVRIPVVSYKPTKNAGVDELVISIPESLRGTGEADLICHVNGVLSNPVRIAIAGAPRAS